MYGHISSDERITKGRKPQMNSKWTSWPLGTRMIRFIAFLQFIIMQRILRKKKSWALSLWLRPTSVHIPDPGHHESTMVQNRKKNTTAKIAIESLFFLQTSDWAVQANEWANGWASDPVLSSGFLIVLNHCGKEDTAWATQRYLSRKTAFGNHEEN